MPTLRLPSALAHPLLGAEPARRRRVMRAVRAGEAVDDPRDAELAVLTAAFVQRTAERARSPRLVLAELVIFGALLVFVLAGADVWLPGPLPLALFLVAAVVVRILARFALAATARRAAEAERENRSLAERHAAVRVPAGDGGGED